MVNTLTTTLGLVLFSSSFALAAQNTAPPTTTPQGNAVAAPAQSGWTAGIKTRTHRHGGKKHHTHHKHQKPPVTKK